MYVVCNVRDIRWTWKRDGANTRSESENAGENDHELSSCIFDVLEERECVMSQLESSDE